MSEPVDRPRQELNAAIKRTASVAEATVERVGNELEAAVRRQTARRATRTRVRRLAVRVLAPTAVAAIAVGVYVSLQQVEKSPENARRTSSPTRLDDAVAVSAAIAIFPVVTPQGLRSDCFRVEAGDGSSRVRCPRGEAARFATYAFVDEAKTTLYGRAAIPGAARVVLRFPGQRSYPVDLQHSAYWAWDSPTAALTQELRGLVVLVVDRDGRLLARDTEPAASRDA